jgi:hypothetical protein
MLKIIKKLLGIKTQIVMRPMNDKERAIWNSPEEVAKRKQILLDGVAIFERI